VDLQSQTATKSSRKALGYGTFIDLSKAGSAINLMEKADFCARVMKEHGFSPDQASWWRQAYTCRGEEKLASIGVLNGGCGSVEKEPYDLSILRQRGTTA
jgi:hypothetical protein